MLSEIISEHIIYVLMMYILMNIVEYILLFWIHLQGFQLLLMVFGLQEFKLLGHAKSG